MDMSVKKGTIKKIKRRKKYVHYRSWRNGTFYKRREAVNLSHCIYVEYAAITDRAQQQCTYSLPSLEYLKKIFDKRTENVTLIAHEKFADKASHLKELYPDLEIILKPDVHAKYVLIEPDTVWLSSANFGSSGWFDQTIGIHDKDAYEFMLSQTERYLKRGEE